MTKESTVSQVSTYTVDTVDPSTGVGGIFDVKIEYWLRTLEMTLYRHSSDGVKMDSDRAITISHKESDTWSMIHWEGGYLSDIGAAEFAARLAYAAQTATWMDRQGRDGVRAFDIYMALIAQAS